MSKGVKDYEMCDDVYLDYRGYRLRRIYGGPHYWYPSNSYKWIAYDPDKAEETAVPEMGMVRVKGFEAHLGHDRFDMIIDRINRNLSPFVVNW